MKRIVELRVALEVGGRGELRGDAELLERSWEGGTESTKRAVSAHGAPLGIPTEGFDGIAAEWLRDGSGPAGDVPAHAEKWGEFVRLRIEALVGAAQWKRLMADAQAEDTQLRLVFRPRDVRAARLPFEFVTTAAGGGLLAADQARRVSILRLPDTLHDDASTTTEPLERDRRESTACVALASGDDALGELVSALKRGPMMVELYQPRNETTLRQLLSRSRVAIVAAHGESDGLVVPDRPAMSPGEVAELLADGPAVAVLAACGSAHGPAGPPAVLTVARRGVAIAIGFEGAEVQLPHVVRFLKVVLGAVNEQRLPRAFDDWETRVMAGRRELQGEAGLPVMYVHPALLERLPRPTSLRSRRPPAGPVTVPVWRVAGQVASWHDGRRVVRVPLPVDAGERIEVAVEGKNIDMIGGPWKITTLDVRNLAIAMDLPEDDGIRAVLMPPRDIEGADVVEADGWAAKAGQLTALARALGAIRDAPMPPGARELLARVVKEEWGCYDGRPQVICMRSGELLEVLPHEWPALRVLPQSLHGPQPLPTQPPELASAPDLDSFTERDVLRLIERQRSVVARSARRGDPFKRAADGKREPWVLIPGAAIVTKGQPPAGETPALAGVDPLDDRPFA